MAVLTANEAHLARRAIQVEPRAALEKSMEAHAGLLTEVARHQRVPVENIANKAVAFGLLEEGDPRRKAFASIDVRVMSGERVPLSEVIAKQVEPPTPSLKDAQSVLLATEKVAMDTKDRQLLSSARGTRQGLEKFESVETQKHTPQTFGRAVGLAAPVLEAASLALSKSGTAEHAQLATSGLSLAAAFVEAENKSFEKPQTRSSVVR